MLVRPERHGEELGRKILPRIDERGAEKFLGAGCAQDLDRQMPGAGAAFDGGGVEAVNLQLIADFGQKPQLLFA